MFYCIKDKKIIGQSTTPMEVPNSITIERDFNEEENNKIKYGYYYNIETNEFEESEQSVISMNKEIQDNKNIILKQLGELKQIKDGMELVGDDITEITAKINALISEYKSL